MRLLLVFLLLATVARAATPSAAPLRAGAATSVITPPLGTPIVGGFAPFPADDVHDELHARCLVLDDGRTKLAFVICDLLGLHRTVSVEARRLITAATGIPASHVLIAGTHTHSAGSALGESRFAYEQPLNDYQRFVAQRVADGVQRAVRALRPAEIAFGTVDAPEHVFNRRWLMREGTAPVNPFGKIERARMNPPTGSPNLIEPAGPTDPTVSFIAVREPNGRPISVLAAYSLHYVGGVAGRAISADYYGVFCEELKRLVASADDGPPFVALLANGTSGDINNIDFRAAGPRLPPYEKMRRVGRDVAGKVHAALRQVAWRDRAELAAQYREIPIQWRTIGPEILAWAKETEAKAPRLERGDIPVGARWPTTPDWVQRLSYAGRVQILATAEQPARIPLQAFRIGDIGIGTFPCETFAETGLEFKKRTPSARGFMIELSHGYFGYLPTPRHFALGGYETWPGTNYLEPEAATKMLATLLEMSAELQAGAR
ncbi:neutral/alkaline non-lysosomal ceramidase N-terminal domain-containing protein [Horticoccus sp. 23ND18S-11]|uniref:neutral/alkaline non-lysosomal ceramidase N-terminal domain-containing protein n=1 Tax=Horticoccus sp. 23ND18S-11 TaxID=3391832 RepID=UPI0039C9CDD8